MYKVYKASKDTYITDRIIRGVRRTNSNVGKSKTLDLFKIYGANKSGSVDQLELSRLLVKFDLDNIRSLVSAGLLNTNNSSFNCSMKLFDISSGTPTPNNFTVTIYPLSNSWDEGIGKDVSYYQDIDTCNFITSSYTNGVAVAWYASGANAGGLLNSNNIDYIASGNLGSGVTNFVVTQSFTTGFENLEVDITSIISGTLAGLIPDNGFRISFSSSQENDEKTRFVKRFASRHASDNRMHPKLLLRYNDAIIDNQNNFKLNRSGTLFMYNYDDNAFTNVVSGSSLSVVSGTNCMLLRIEAPISGGLFTQIFTASQHSNMSGVYSASFAILSTNTGFNRLLNETGSITFKQIWTSLDQTIAYHSSSFIAALPTTTSYNPIQQNYRINIFNTKNEYRKNEIARFRAFISDPNHQLKAKKLPQELQSIVLNNMHIQVRDAITDEIVVPYDTTYNSTLMSLDSNGLYYDFDMACLEYGRTYVVDVVRVERIGMSVFKNCSTVFRINEIT